eukprot:785972-Amphidinium_carterae.1
MLLAAKLSKTLVPSRVVLKVDWSIRGIVVEAVNEFTSFAATRDSPRKQAKLVDLTSSGFTEGGWDAHPMMLIQLKFVCGHLTHKAKEVSVVLPLLQCASATVPLFCSFRCCHGAYRCGACCCMGFSGETGFGL